MKAIPLQIPPYHSIFDKPFFNANKITNKVCIQIFNTYSKTCVKRPLSKRQKISFQDQLLLNAGQKYCRMLQVEHSAILLTFVKVPIVLSIIEWPFYTGFFCKFTQEINRQKMMATEILEEQ